VESWIRNPGLRLTGSQLAVDHSENLSASKFRKGIAAQRQPSFAYGVAATPLLAEPRFRLDSAALIRPQVHDGNLSVRMVRLVVTRVGHFLYVKVLEV